MGFNEAASPKPRRSIRWWPAVLVCLAAVGALVWVWGWYGVSRQERVIATARVALFTLVALLLWVTLFSRAKPGLRWTVLGGVIGAIALTAALFRIRGVTGDLLPILEFRGKRPLVQAIDPVRPTEAAEIKTSSADYPQFLGPNRNASVDGLKLARDWSANPPKRLWRQPIGAAWSGFAVVADHAVTQEQRGGDESVVCYDLNSGRILWSHADKVRYFTTIAGEGPRATPALSSNRVYALGATGILNCLDLATGRLVWSKDIVKDHQGHIPDWGVSSSPLIVDQLVVVSASVTGRRSLLAFDKESGQIAWSSGTDDASYSSPCLATIGGVRQILTFNAHSLSAHAVESGSSLWEYPWPGGHPHIALPLVLPQDRVLISSGYGTGSELLQIQAEKKWLPLRIWKSTRLKAKFTNVVWREGFIYGLDDGILVCLDATDGSLKWKEGRYGHGQVILVGGLLLVIAEAGDVLLIEPIPEEHRKLASFRALNDKTWNPPALAGEYLLVRNDKEAAGYRMPLAK